MDINELRKRVEKAKADKDKCIRNINKSTGKKHELYCEQFKALNEKYWLLQERLDYYESNLVASTDELEIKRFGNELISMYGIYLKGQGIKIGHIDYQGYHSSIISGDIGYVINSQFKGHNYAYKALCLLSDFLYKNGVSDFYISVFFNNMPSIKTIEKYGGILLRDDGRLRTYQCDTRALLEEKKLINDKKRTSKY